MWLLDREKLATAVRIKRGRTDITEAAEAAGIGRGTMYRIESGTMHDFGVEKFLRVCAWIDVPADYFVIKEGEPEAAEAA